MLGNDKSSLISLENQTLFSLLQTKSVIKSQFSGYIEADFEHEVNPNNIEKWYLYFSNGKIVFSNTQKIEFSSIVRSLQNYLPGLRPDSLSSSDKIIDLIYQSKEDQNLSIKKYLEELILIDGKVGYEKIIETIKLHITVNSEKYLFKNPQSVSLIEDLEIDKFQHISSLEIDCFLDTMESRKAEWDKIVKIIPSLNYLVKENQDPANWDLVSAANQKSIKKILSSGSTLEEIRYELGEDTLKTAQLFTNLIQNKLVNIEEANSQNSSEIDKGSNSVSLVSESDQEIFLIDDSPLILKQVNQIITALGYKSLCCENALEAVPQVLKSNAKAIFIDINMPEISGFELMKNIRSEPKLKSIPIVILTGEKTLMNQQRAKWLKCEFLIKPINPGDKLRFLSDIKSTLDKLVPIQ